VHQLGLVHRGERGRQSVREHMHRAGDQRTVRLDRDAERRAGHVLRGEPWRGRIGVGVDDGSDPGAGHAPADLHLAPEPLPELLVVCEPGVHDLDRNLLAVPVRTQIDPTHPTGAEPT
jgi:hypothetical protein